MSWIFIFHRGRIWGQFRVFSSHEAKDLNLTRNRFKFHYLWYNNYKQWKNIIFRLSFGENCLRVFLYVHEHQLDISLQADVNVIVIDWRRGAMTLNYLQAAANTRLVGAIAAVMVEKLNHTYNIQPSMIHIIGHSLGAHIAGYIGERVPRIARITGKSANKWQSLFRSN